MIIMEINQQVIGESLLFPLFRCIDDSYKERYKKDVWEQFENNIRAASYTAKLSTFYENITRQMPIVMQRQYGDEILKIIQSGMDKEVLNWLRDETTYLVLIARMRNEDRKKDLKERDLFNIED